MGSLLTNSVDLELPGWVPISTPPKWLLIVLTDPFISSPKPGFDPFSASIALPGARIEGSVGANGLLRRHNFAAPRVYMSHSIAGLRIERCALRNLLAGLALFAALGSTQALAIGEDEFLPPEQAFKYTATADEKQVTVEWQATKGYYLYKKRLGLSAATAGVTVGESVYPKGEIHKDDYFGEQEVFRGNFKVTAPLTGAKAGDTVALKLKWQGCADAGLCYPPSVWDASVKVAAAAATAAVTTADKIFSERAKPAASPAVEGEEEYLDPDVAFVLTAEAQSTNNIQLNWRIADGYYLYKK